MPKLPTIRVTFRITDTYYVDLQCRTPKEAMDTVHRRLEKGCPRVDGAMLVQSEYSVPRWQYVKTTARKRLRSRPGGEAAQI